MSDKTVLLTGASGNLGAATARAFQRAGATTVLVDRVADRLHHQYPDLVVSPDHLLLGGVNLTDEASVASAIGSAIERFGRTTVGTSGQPPEAWPGHAGAFLAGAVRQSPVEGLTSALALRFLCDDLKALYGEAAQAAGPRPGIRQVDAWFWTHTVAGRILVALRAAGMQSEENAVRTVASRFFVPTPYLPG